jgi:protein O-GlcNAc transferase
MSKKTIEKPKRQKVVQPVVGKPIQAINGPPQFLIDAADANNAGEYDKAIDFLKHGISQDRFVACKGIGDIYLSRGENDRAMEWLEKARECMPQSVAVIGSMGQVLVSLGREEEAVEIFSTAIQQQDEGGKVRSLVESMRQVGLADKAIEILEGMIEVNPHLSEIVFELAEFFQIIGRLDKAEACYKQHVELTPTYQAYNQLGLICRKMGRTSEAVEYFRKTVKLQPTFAGGWNNLCMGLMEIGCIEESIELSRIIVIDTPNVSNLHSNYLLRLHYSQSLDQQAIFEEHKTWGQRYAPISMAKTSHNNMVDPDRKLRIGYISPDFAKCVTACYITVLLDSHNPDAVELYGYGNVESPDEVTFNLQNKFDQYRDIWNVGDEAVARIIEQDKIDILVELAGHTKDNRLLVLAYKPAPIQVTYLGYGDTTGMEAIDYLLTDNMATPSELQNFYTEELFPLPGGLCCYKPLITAPAANPPPAVKNGYVTFGAFTKVWRLNNRLLGVWGEILKLTGNSRLILGCRGGDDEGLQHRFLSQFEQCGISQERIEIRGIKPYHLYLKQYNDVDIVLDTFPENGGTTTCDALWMGVPVVSLTGQHQVERVGLSILSCIGMESLATATPSEYVAKAVALANDPESLIEMRKSMRPRMVESPLCDSKRFAQDLESAYREMWHRWCRKHSVSVPS